ncbi:hypothetical protein C4901_15315 [Acidiferrobacter sp. SPIII_3]|uniref:hypothetical protein n=1 Tax=Acidiferrobacter sp. SPIII_3 TaxID=1281578 RepID=UPI000D726F2A|nr:hypothetical protein [Acidiferrobacter sp. SPIII_3]AWP24525.1 hypothetical protein C4901_15315 [Acidiferrobacter sp. SPIII_3]
MSNYQAEKIAEFLEEQSPGCGTHHTLYFDPDSGKFVLESVGVEINEGDVEVADLEADEALDWLTEVAGMSYMAAVRAIIGVDEDTPR